MDGYAYELKGRFSSRDGWGRLKDGAGTDGTQDDRHDRPVMRTSPRRTVAGAGNKAAKRSRIQFTDNK